MREYTLYVGADFEKLRAELDENLHAIPASPVHRIAVQTDKASFVRVLIDDKLVYEKTGEFYEIILSLQDIAKQVDKLYPGSKDAVYALLNDALSGGRIMWYEILPDEPMDMQTVEIQTNRILKRAVPGGYFEDDSQVCYDIEPYPNALNHFEAVSRTASEYGFHTELEELHPAIRRKLLNKVAQRYVHVVVSNDLATYKYEFYIEKSKLELALKFYC